MLKRIYSCEAYYERVKLYLNRAHPSPRSCRGSGEEPARQPSNG